MYTTKLRNKKDSPFKYAVGSKEEIAEKKSKDKWQSADKAAAERYGKVERKKPTPEEQEKRKNFSVQPPLKGMTTGYFGSVYQKSKKGDSAGAPVGHAAIYKRAQKDYFATEYAKYEGAPKLNTKAKRDKFRSKNGGLTNFGSNDVHRSEEFCNAIRQSQWKELLNTETKFQTQWSNQAAATRGIDSVDQLLDHPNSRAIKNAAENEDRAARGLPEFFQTQIPDHLYDVGKTNEHAPCFRCKSNRFYCPHRVKSGIVNNRRVGGGEYKLMSAEVGGRVWGVSSKPAHGRIQYTSQFNDISHL